MTPHPKHTGFAERIDPDILVRFAKLVRDMRQAQQRYFRFRTEETLMRSKVAEAKVDEALAWIAERAAAVGQLSIPFEESKR